MPGTIFRAKMLGISFTGRGEAIINCGHDNSMLTTLNLTPLVPMYRTRKGTHNDANIVYI
jgi:hypothetical protein